MGFHGRTRYKELYFECLRKCCKLLQERKMYEEALKLCDRAVKDYPFEEWQLIQIDCLLALNRYQEALDVYENAASIFLRRWAIHLLRKCCLSLGR